MSKQIGNIDYLIGVADFKNQLKEGKSEKGNQSLVGTWTERLQKNEKEVFVV
jgi:hypothetical protein